VSYCVYRKTSCPHSTTQTIAIEISFLNISVRENCPNIKISCRVKMKGVAEA